MLVKILQSAVVVFDCVASTSKSDTELVLRITQKRLCLEHGFGFRHASAEISRFRDIGRQLQLLTRTPTGERVQSHESLERLLCALPQHVKTP